MKFPVVIEVSLRHIEFLHDHRIFTSRSGKIEESWLKPGGRLRFAGKVEVEPYTEFQNGPNLHSLGAFSFTRSSLGAGVSAGRYSVMADNVALMAHAHPTDRLTFANIDYYTGHICYTAAVADSGKPHLPRTKWNNLPKPDVKIGHSVWIGSNVLLKRSVTIGTGSLVAARSVVTKDVPPYTMVAGNPAVPRGKFDGRRHPAELVERLLLSEWWAYSFTDFHGLDTTDPERFLDGFEVAVQQGRLQRYDPGAINLPEALLGIS